MPLEAKSPAWSKGRYCKRSSNMNCARNVIGLKDHKKVMREGCTIDGLETRFLPKTGFLVQHPQRPRDARGGMCSLVVKSGAVTPVSLTSRDLLGLDVPHSSTSWPVAQIVGRTGLPGWADGLLPQLRASPHLGPKPTTSVVRRVTARPGLSKRKKSLTQGRKGAREKALAQDVVSARAAQMWIGLEPETAAPRPFRTALKRLLQTRDGGAEAPTMNQGWWR